LGRSLIFGYGGNAGFRREINFLNAELNPIYYLLALLGAHPILHVSRIRVKTHVTQNGTGTPTATPYKRSTSFLKQIFILKFG
jgi:hypothetical protein